MTFRVPTFLFSAVSGVAAAQAKSLKWNAAAAKGSDESPFCFRFLIAVLDAAAVENRVVKRWVEATLRPVPGRRGSWLPALAALVASPALAQSAQQQANALAADALASGAFKANSNCPTRPTGEAARRLSAVESLAPLMATGRYYVVRCKFTGTVPDKFETTLRAAGATYVALQTLPAKLTFAGSTSSVHRGSAAYTKHCNPYALGYCTGDGGYNERTADEVKTKYASKTIDGFEGVFLVLVLRDAPPIEELRVACAFYAWDTESIKKYISKYRSNLPVGALKEEANRRLTLAKEVRDVLALGKWKSIQDYSSHLQEFQRFRSAYNVLKKRTDLQRDLNCVGLKRKARDACEDEASLELKSFLQVNETQDISSARQAQDRSKERLNDIIQLYPSLILEPEVLMLRDIVELGPYSNVGYFGSQREAKDILYNLALSNRDLNRDLAMYGPDQQRCYRLYPKLWHGILEFMEDRSQDNHGLS